MLLRAEVRKAKSPRELKKAWWCQRGAVPEWADSYRDCATKAQLDEAPMPTNIGRLNISRMHMLGEGRWGC